MKRDLHRNPLARIAAAVALSACVALPALAEQRAQAEARQAIRRFALVVGANDGGRQRVPLRYAGADARAMARVLRQLGGVAPQDLVLVLVPDRLALADGFTRLSKMLAGQRSPGRRVELLFYYSGHSDEAGLLLGGQRFEYKRLRRLLDSLDAEVRIAVLDSCASGAMTRGKGGRRRPPFLVDRSSDVRGHAYLTSASATETAQESDRIRASFFTHYLITGLRGAADLNRDGRVSLNEAYNHAFSETLARTESTSSGPQHPNYDMQLVGSGDLTITDLRGTSALMVLAPDMGGRLFIRDRRGHLVAEINKQQGRAISLGLEPGTFKVTLEDRGRLRRGTVRLADRKQTLVKLAMLGQAEALEQTRGRGSADASLQARAGPPFVRPVSISLFPGLSSNGKDATRAINYFALNWIAEYGGGLRGLELSLGGAVRMLDVSGVQLSMGFHHVLGHLRGLQLTLAYNWVGRGVRGWQLSGGLNGAGAGVYGVQLNMGANWAGGPVKGVQLSGAFNGARGALDGVQFNMGANWAGGPVTGAQLAGAVNVATAGATGLQLSGAFNLAGKMTGAQLATAINLAGQAHGFQLSGGLNIARELSGFQLSPANLARGQTRGVQLGLINIAGPSTGLQLGLINIASSDRGLVPLGLVNVVGDGTFAPTFFSTGSSLFNAGLKLGGKKVYGLLGLGIHPGDDSEQRFSLFTGLGGHIPLGRFYVDIDLALHSLHARYLWADKVDLLNQLRAALGLQITEALSVYAGPTLDLLVSEERRHPGYVANLWSREPEQGGTEVSLGLGFVAGVQVAPRWGKLNRY